MSRWDNKEMGFSTLCGKVLTAVETNAKEMHPHEPTVIIFTTEDGSSYMMYHETDCCETVYIESIVGDLEDLVGTPILFAEMRCSADIQTVPDYIYWNAKLGKVPTRDGGRDDSQTWTFYSIRTIKGSVDIRWYGSSNGYYSESVDFVLIDGHKECE